MHKNRTERKLDLKQSLHKFILHNDTPLLKTPAQQSAVNITEQKHPTVGITAVVS